jgi:osmotically-inducible protein OsmY
MEVPMKTSKSLRKYIALPVLLVAFTGGCASSRTQESTGEYIDDATITTRVRAALVGDSNIKSTDITVETYRGVVQLSGFVDDEDQIARAAEDARSQQGVKGVRNDLHVKSAPRQ